MRFLKCTISFFLVGVLFIPAANAQAEKPEPAMSIPELQQICPGPLGAPTIRPALEGSAGFAPLGCRIEHQWQFSDRWLCSIGPHTVLSDYPIDEVGIIDGLHRRTGKCRLVTPAPPCRGEIHLVQGKFCRETLKQGPGWWERFASFANAEVSPLGETCPKVPQPHIDFLSNQVRTHCNTESCVLLQREELWQTVLDQDSADSLDEPFWQALTTTTLVATRTEEERHFPEPGLYCVSSSSAHDRGTPQPARILQATLLEPVRTKAVLPKAAQPSTDQVKTIDSLRCATDADCIQGKGNSQCMLRSLAIPPRVVPDPSYRCRCVTGPTVFGCVASRTDRD